MYVTARILAVLLAAGLLVACGKPGGSSQGVSSTQAMEPDHASSRDFGAYVLHFTAIPTN